MIRYYYQPAVACISQYSKQAKVAALAATVVRQYRQLPLTGSSNADPEWSLPPNAANRQPPARHAAAAVS